MAAIASTPLGRCTIDAGWSARRRACDARTRAMFPELDDNDPPGAVLWRARFADQGRSGAIPKGSSGDCSIAGARGDLTHDGIDHVVISESLKKRLAPTALTMRAINYTNESGDPLRGGRDVALPSDHCPHVVTWTPLRGSNAMTPRERQSQLLERAGRDIAGGGLGLFVLPPELNLVVARGEGSRVLDVAGREYIDYHLAPDRRCSATRIRRSPRRSRRSCRKGTTFYFLNEPEIELAEQAGRRDPVRATSSTTRAPARKRRSTACASPARSPAATRS